MSVRSELKEVSAIRRELKVEVEAERVARELEHVLGEIAATARIPGFRQGKVPRSLLRKRYAREIENELIEHLVPPALREALEGAGAAAAPVHQPVIRDVSLEDGKPMSFTAAFEVRPRIVPRDYRGVVVRQPEIRIEEQDILREIEVLREAQATYTAVDARPIEKGDYALVDLQRKTGDETRDQPNALIEAGAEEYHPEFTRELLGMTPGETRSFDVAYAEDDPDPDARGQTVRYTLHLREVKKKLLPELDDEFAKDGGVHQTLADMKAAIRKDLEQRAEHRVRMEEERQLAEALVPAVDGEIPQALLEAELDRMLDDQVRALVARGVDPRTAPIDWRATREKMRDQAVRSVKWELLLEAIGDKESIEASQEDVERRLEKIAASAQKSVEFVRSKIEKDGRMPAIQHAARLVAVVDFLLRNAKIERR